MQSKVRLENTTIIVCKCVILFYFFNRREVYRILQEEGIDLPRYAVLNRDPDKPDGQSAFDNE